MQTYTCPAPVKICDVNTPTLDELQALLVDQETYVDLDEEYDMYGSTSEILELLDLAGQENSPSHFRFYGDLARLRPVTGEYERRDSRGWHFDDPKDPRSKGIHTLTIGSNPTEVLEGTFKFLEAQDQLSVLSFRRLEDIATIARDIKEGRLRVKPLDLGAFYYFPGGTVHRRPIIDNLGTAGYRLFGRRSGLDA